MRLPVGVSHRRVGSVSRDASQRGSETSIRFEEDTVLGSLSLAANHLANAISLLASRGRSACGDGEARNPGYLRIFICSLPQ